MDLPENWEQWETMWDHATLAHIVTQIWGKEKGNIHKSIGDELRDFDLLIDEPTMNIHNIRGEQQVLTALVKIVAHHSVEDYNTPEKQRRYTKIIHSKLVRGNVYRDDMDALGEPITIKQWIKNFKRVREEAR